MRFINLVIIAVISAFVASCGLGEKKTYFTCAGTETQTGSEQSTSVHALSLTMTSYNNIPTLLGRRNLQGDMLLTNDRVASFHFSKLTDQILLLTGDTAGTGGTGSFDRISRHLVADTKDVRYDLVCREAELAG